MFPCGHEEQSLSSQNTRNHSKEQVHCHDQGPPPSEHALQATSRGLDLRERNHDIDTLIVTVIRCDWGNWFNVGSAFSNAKLWASARHLDLTLVIQGDRLWDLVTPHKVSTVRAQLIWSVRGTHHASRTVAA